MNEGFVSPDLELDYEVGTRKNVLHAIMDRDQPEQVSPIVNQLYVVSLFQRGWRGIDAFAQSALNSRLNFEAMLADVYRVEEPENITNGWKITANALERLRDRTAASGSKLVVMQLPDPYQLDANCLGHFEDEGVAVDAQIPSRRLQAICAELNITHHDLYPATRAWIDREDISHPYLSHTCDRHFSPMGHAFTATELQRYIEETLLR